MVEQSGSARVAVRFGAYIDELREFFTSRGVGFGSPDDMVGFAERVASPGPFQDEMGSLVRSIQFREADSIGRGEMLELVSVAVGGPQVEAAAQQMHASVRQIFVFVNDALRQRRWAFPGEVSEAGEDAVTAGHILAATTARDDAEERAVSKRGPENGFPSGTEAPRNAVTRREPESATETTGIMFKAISMSDHERDHPESTDSDTGGSQRPWLVPAIVVGGIVLAIAGYFGAAATHHLPGNDAAGGLGSVQTQSRPVSAASCVGSSAGASRTGLQDRSRWAHGLLDQKLYDAALPELRQIAQADPGYPGINLDESNALLQLRRPEEARDAVDAQIGISECLAKLPGAALDAYCSAEFSPSTVGGCRGQLGRIRQAAELQAALVHLELGHRAAPDAGAPDPVVTEATRLPGAEAPAPARSSSTSTEAARIPHAKRSAPLPPASEGDTGEPPPARAVVATHAGASKQDRKNGGDDALRRGEGTDSVYGAYSKPQE